MIERAAERGVPLESIYEEEGAVDTISNFVNVAEILSSLDDFKDIRLKGGRVVIVAGSDHLPRTTWIADHILPDDVEIVCVESNPALDSETYTVSCERERLSFHKGSKWIGGTRNLAELEQIVNSGYFGVERKSAEQIAQEVAVAALKGESYN